MPKNPRWSLTRGAALLVSIAGTGSAQSPKLRILVPAYFYPSGNGLKEWDRLLRSPGLDVMTVMTANSNP